MSKNSVAKRLLKSLRTLNFSDKKYKQINARNAQLAGNPTADQLLERLEHAVRKITPKKSVGKVYLKKGQQDSSTFYDFLGTPIINTPDINSPGTMAHELGHLFTHMEVGDGMRVLPTTLNPIKSWKHMSGFINEELQASGKGLRAMKAAGYSPEDINRAREELKYALRSYKQARLGATGGTIMADAIVAAPSLVLMDGIVNNIKGNKDKKDKK